jgi:hypothetical protein
MAKKKITVDVFPKDTEVTIKIDNTLYIRLVEIVVESALKFEVKKLDEHFQNIISGKPQNQYELHMQTILFLVSKIEDAVREQKVAVEEEIEIGSDDDEEPKSSETPG